MYYCVAFLRRKQMCYSADDDSDLNELLSSPTTPAFCLPPCRAWLVHSSPNKTFGEVIFILQHVSLRNEKVCGDGGGWSAGTRLLSAGAVGEKVIPLECQ